MKVNSKLKYLVKAVQGEVWTLEDDPAQLVEFYNSSLDIGFSTGNSMCALIGKTIREYTKGEVEAIFQLNEGASLTLGGEEKDESVILTRMFEDEYLKLRSPFLDSLLNLTSGIKSIDDPAECHSGGCDEECLCPECKKNQERIKYNPSIHPLYGVLKNIAYSRIEHVFQFLGTKHRGISCFTPNAMRTHEGWCHLYSPECEIQINLTKVFSIRVEQERVDGRDYSIIHGRNQKNAPVFRISAKGGEVYQTWAKLISEAKFLS